MTIEGGAPRLTVELKKRNANVDAVRICALVAVVIGHVYTHNEITDRLIQSWRLPVFFMLSGFFWSASKDLKSEAKDRARRLLVPYAWWALIFAAISLPFTVGRGPDSLFPTLGRLVLGGSYVVRPYTTFWFFTALFVATVLYRFLTTLPSWVRLATVSAGLGLNVLYGQELAQAPFAALSALGAMVFLEAGRLTHALSRRLGGKILALIGVGCLSAAASVLLMTDDFVPLDMKSGQFSLLAVLIAFLFCVALLIAATLAPQPSPRVARVMDTLSRPTLAVILLHPLMLWVLRPESGVIPLPVVTVIALVVPWAAGLLIARTRFAYSLLGVPSTR
ncbi:acyltransferase [Arthrobacter sp. zg-Y1219]|uniref:acyltransferase family protein n=1 Tax=Arthrobacter sp. zg-Y1219 TaxID=3049067 RepID=UPI0024C45175|nr:acyltransferase [Arthrobacter sp. zg-Y1219]MDK1360190.1 acyltransferase [Arthrobacter sp. zg-Y1219]